VRHEDKNKETGEGDQNAKSLRCHSRAHFGRGGNEGDERTRRRKKGVALPIGSINGGGTVLLVAADGKSIAAHINQSVGSITPCTAYISLHPTLISNTSH